MVHYRIKFLILSCILLSSSLIVKAQDIAGVWVGNYGKSFMMTQPNNVRLEFEFVNDSTIKGLTHLDYKRNHYEHYTIKGKYNKKDSTIQFVEDSTIGVQLGAFASNCLGQYTMKLVLCNDSLMRFEGKWKDKNRGFMHCPTTDVWFQKRLTNKQIKPLIANENNKKPHRPIDVQSIIEVKPQELDSIKIEVYDNGIIDGDSISILYNDTVLVQKRALSAQPIVMHLSLSQQIKMHKIQLFAEHMGSIPPCTAFMVITTKKKRYEVNLSSDFSKNAVAELYVTD